ncbi:TraR/DksA C4-type zinc finger protein [Paenibacillus campinasensis]|uniref:Conjugal transfer protein TraR n=1 Tax=Paenibacillus campinasensis TaxID=66347 RepID=A0A268EPR4_9BACL|nr:TraR/DksA C4-type zinc finger protein [Paenibacillus campinasensis]PAD75123.1 conjugal transfer protein TraR [Paenibacillus campinasensis]
MSALTQPQLNELEQRLLQDKARLEQLIGSPEQSGEDSLRDSTGELSAADNHPADLATEEFERSRNLAIHDKQAQELDRIDTALQRMDEGSYGTCAVCGRDIPYERLEALPSTIHCIEHASSHSSEDSRPVEEQVMTPPPSGAGVNRQRNAGQFDDAGAWEAVQDYGTSTSPALSPQPGTDDYKD